MIRYDRLWRTMDERGMTQYRLIKQHGFSAGQIGRMKKNMHVSTHTLDTLCTILGCGLEDIVEYLPGEAAQPETKTEMPAAPAENRQPQPPAEKKNPGKAEKAAPKAEKAKKAGKTKKKGEKKGKAGKKVK